MEKCFISSTLDEQTKKDFKQELENQKQLGNPDAAQKAAEIMAARKKAEIKQKFEIQSKNANAIKNIEGLSRLGDGSTNENILDSFLSNTKVGERGVTVDQLYKGIKFTEYQPVINDIFQTLSMSRDDQGVFRNILDDFTQGQNSVDFVYAVYHKVRGTDLPEHISADIRKAADNYLAIAEKSHKRIVDAGGQVGTLKTWMFPQHYSPDMVLNLWKKSPKAKEAKTIQERQELAREVFTNTFMKYADPEDYKDEFGNARSMAQIEETIKNSFNSIVNEVSDSPSGGGLKGRGGQHRVLHINSPDGWLEVNSLMNNKTLMEMIDNHFDNASKHTALMEWGGPDIKRNLEEVMSRNIKNAEQDNALSKREQSAKDSTIRYLENWANMDVDSPPANWKVSALRGFRQAQTLLLQGATTASMGDFGQMQAAAGAFKASGLELWSSLMRTAVKSSSKETQTFLANQSGLIASSFQGAMFKSIQATSSSGWIKYAGDISMRASLLGRFDNWKRNATRMTMMSAIGKKVRDNETLSGMKGEDAEILKSYGLNDEDWSILKKAKLEKWDFSDSMLTIKGIKDIADVPEDVKQRLAEKLIGAVHVETNNWVMAPTERQRSWVKRSNTVEGELKASIMQLKSFPIAYFYNNAKRVSSMGWKGGGRAYTAQLLAYGIIAGLAVEQSKTLIAGKEPKKMSGKLLFESWMRSGGLGIVTDIIFNSEKGHGMNMLNWAAGPSLSMIVELSEITARPFRTLKEGGEFKEGYLEDMAGDYMKVGAKYIPGSRLFYSELFFNRLFLNRMQEVISPGYNQRVINRAAKEGQNYYWMPGETRPEVAQ